jgi:hypothetical protein
MNLHDKVCELLAAQNDEEIGSFNGPRWGAMVEGDIVEMANENGVDLSLEELDEVFGARAAVVHRVGEETEVHLFATGLEAEVRWDELTADEA